MDEIWKPVVGYEGLYEVSSFGAVRSLDRSADAGGSRGRLLKPALKKHGYLCISLSAYGKRLDVRVHRLVAEAFLPSSDLPEVNHKDCIKTNNAVTNLEWVNRTGNARHAVENGLWHASTNPKRAARTNPNMAKKLTIDEVNALRCDRRAGMKYRPLGEKYGIDGKTAWSIVKGQYWA